MHPFSLPYTSTEVIPFTPSVLVPDVATSQVLVSVYAPPFVAIPTHGSQSPLPGQSVNFTVSTTLMISPLAPVVDELQLFVHDTSCVVPAAPPNTINE